MLFELMMDNCHSYERVQIVGSIYVLFQVSHLSFKFV